MKEVSNKDCGTSRGGAAEESAAGADRPAARLEKPGKIGL
jgi:hypothetical protein